MNKTLIILLITINLIYAKNTYEDIVIEKIVSVYDGDTFKINIKDYPNIIGKNISIRIDGIDTPEIRTKCKSEKILGYKAKELTKKILTNAKTIILKNPKRGKYFRIVANVYVDGKDIAHQLIKSKLAVPYYGKTKTKNWCVKLYQ